MKAAVVIASLVSVSALNEDFVVGGTLKLSWNDCGDSSYHGKVKSLSPDSLTLGQQTTVTGSGTVDEQVTGGAFTIAVKAGVITEHYDGDVCTAKTFKLPLGLGSITWNGLKCPVAQGAVDVGVDVKLSAAIPASLAKTTIDVKATGPSKENLLCMEIKTAPAQTVLPLKEDFVEGGTLKLSWNDCGDSSYHGKVKSLSPDSLTLGQQTTVTGSGTVDEQVTGGAFTIDVKAGVITEHYDGDVCTAKTFKLPLGLGSITWNGLKCPVAQGAVDVGVDVKLSAAIPASLAKTTIEVKATGPSKENLLCMEIKTAPAQTILV